MTLVAHARIETHEQYSPQLERFSELVGNRRLTAAEQKVCRFFWTTPRNPRRTCFLSSASGAM